MEPTQQSPSGSTPGTLQDEILQMIDHPQQLERLYRKNRTSFQRAFQSVYPDIMSRSIARFWHERLNYREDDISWGPKSEWIAVAALILAAGFIVKIPDFTGLDYEFFYPRNAGFAVFPALAAYFFLQRRLAAGQLWFPLLAVALSAVYINALPDDRGSDSILLACLHLPVFLWMVLGFAYLGAGYRSSAGRIDFLRYNGDLVVMSAVMALAGMLFTAVTIGLFELIDLKIGEFYARYVAAWGLPAIPILGTLLVRNNPQLVSRISPVIARIFTPIVFAMLLIFLVAVLYTGVDPYNDRDFLLLFNALLIGVMALILFSVSEATRQATGRIGLLFLSGLSLLAIASNAIALSAIAFRLVEFGITPNRIAVLGANLLIFVHLILVAHALFQVLRGRQEAEAIGNRIARFLPVYGIWAALVTFLFPLLFNFI